MLHFIIQKVTKKYAIEMLNLFRRKNVKRKTKLCITQDNKFQKPK